MDYCIFCSLCMKVSPECNKPCMIGELVNGEHIGSKCTSQVCADYHVQNVALLAAWSELFLQAHSKRV